MRLAQALMDSTDGLEAARVLEQPDPPRLVLMDWMMPGMDGVDVCRRVRQSVQEPYIYVVLLTARDLKDDIVSGMEAGADDYLTKPFNQAELRARLRAAQRILDLQRELIEARERLRVEATHDALTGLLNRRAIIEIMAREVSRANRERAGLSVLMVDIDHFKQVNDVHGHPVGDAALREVASRLQASIRLHDFVGRFGGEEFIVLAINSEPVGALALAERLRRSVAEAPLTFDGGSLPATISVGVATFAAGEAESHALIRCADAALYRAKALGRNRCEVGTTDPAGTA